MAYICQECGESFRKPSLLAKHRRTENHWMSEMRVDHRTLSRHLWGVLDGIGLFPEMREAKTNATISHGIVHTLWEGVLKGNNRTFYSSGSMQDATTTLGLQSDVDTIYVHEDDTVFENLQNAPQNAYCLLLIQESSTPAGYAKLQLVKDGIPVNVGTVHTCTCITAEEFNVDGYGRLLRNNNWKRRDIYIPFHKQKLERNGPAITRIVHEGLTADEVNAYRCASWPDVAKKWLTRDRRHNWPTQEQIQKLSALACFVVGVGHPHSPEHTLGWRISFWLQERHLMRALNESQYKCYVLMKVFKKDFITSQYPDSISSYHCKTVLFYAIESTPAEFWVPENLVHCLLHCLVVMYKCAVVGVCPSYFIPEANLFDRRMHGELREQVASLLNELLRGNGQFLFRISCDNIGIQLLAAFLSGAPQITSTQLVKMLVRRYMLNRYAIIAILPQLKYYCGHVSVETMQDQISRLVSTPRVAEHTASETREAVQYILTHLHTSLVSGLAVAIVPGDSENNKAGNMRTLMEEQVQLAITTSPGVTSCRLKVAAIYYMLEDYNAAERMLSDAAAALSGIVLNACHCQMERSVLCPTRHFPDTLEGCKDFVNSHMCYCISFLPSEMAVTPAALQYEMFKSRGPPTECKEKLPWWYQWSNVDGKVFLHYMQYLLYDKLGDVGRRHRARDDLIDVAVTDVSLSHRETAYNLLGWIFKQEGYVILAARCFLLSIRMEHRDNAAKWHIGDLYLRQSVFFRP